MPGPRPDRRFPARTTAAGAMRGTSSTSWRSVRQNVPDRGRAPITSCRRPGHAGPERWRLVGEGGWLLDGDPRMRKPGGRCDDVGWEARGRQRIIAGRNLAQTLIGFHAGYPQTAEIDAELHRWPPSVPAPGETTGRRGGRTQGSREAIMLGRSVVEVERACFAGRRAGKGTRSRAAHQLVFGGDVHVGGGEKKFCATFDRRSRDHPAGSRQSTRFGPADSGAPRRREHRFRRAAVLGGPTFTGHSRRHRRG